MVRVRPTTSDAPWNRCRHASSLNTTLCGSPGPKVRPNAAVTPSVVKNSGDTKRAAKISGAVAPERAASNGSGPDVAMRDVKARVPVRISVTSAYDSRTRPASRVATILSRLAGSRTAKGLSAIDS